MKKYLAFLGSEMSVCNLVQIQVQNQDLEALIVFPRGVGILSAAARDREAKKAGVTIHIH